MVLWRAQIPKKIIFRIIPTTISAIIFGSSIIAYYQLHIEKIQLKQIINNEISTVYEKCESKNNGYLKSDQICSSLVLLGPTALPYIFKYIEQSTNTVIDNNNPFSLYNFRKEIINNNGYTCLIKSILKICINDEKKSYIDYFKKLLKENPDKNLKQSIILANILRYFNDSDLLNLQKKILTESFRHRYSYFNKALIGSYLYTNIGKGYFPLKQEKILYKYTNRKSYQRKIKYPITESNNIEQYKRNIFYIDHPDEYNFTKIFNGELFWYQVHNYSELYNLNKNYFYLNTNSDGTPKTTYEPAIFKKFQNDYSDYVFGYDFYNIGINYLDIDSTFLGKSFFEKTFFHYLRANKSGILENEFIGSFLDNSTINDTGFYSCLLNSVHIGRSSKFKSVEFNNCSFINSKIYESSFNRTQFIQSEISDSLIRYSFFINSNFSGCNLNNVVLDDVFMDKKTLDSFLSNGQLASNYKIIHEGILDFDKYSINDVTTIYSNENTPIAKKLKRLFTTRLLSYDYYKFIVSITRDIDLYRISTKDEIRK